MIDRSTYEKYQQCADPELRPLFENYVVLNTEAPSDDYARFTLIGSHCPALAEGLCSIQSKLGEEYLSKTCLTYPRVVNQVDDVLQRSLHLSCPEAARLVLLDPAPIALRLQEGAQDTSRAGNLVEVDTSRPGPGGKSYRHFTAIQSYVISLLQDRAYPLSQRLLMLNAFSNYLDELLSQDNSDGILALIRQPRARLSQNSLPAQPLLQLETVLELIIGRISSDFTNRRFLDCYQQLMKGLDWTMETSMTDLERRYAQARSTYFAPLVSAHEHILENYVVNYVFKTLFPFGAQDRKQRQILPDNPSASAHCALLVTYYAIIRTLAIGVAAFQKDAFGTGHLVQVTQTTSRTFEHSTAYPERIMEMLRAKGMLNQAGMAVLVSH